MKLRCYCCGEEITDPEFAICSMSDTPDRVFLALREHVTRFEATNFFFVRRTTNAAGSVRISK